MTTRKDSFRNFSTPNHRRNISRSDLHNLHLKNSDRYLFLKQFFYLFDFNNYSCNNYSCDTKGYN